MHGIAKVVMWVLVGSAYLYVLAGFAKKFERKKIMVVGEEEDRDKVLPLAVLAAFVGTLLVLGE